MTMFAEKEKEPFVDFLLHLNYSKIAGRVFDVTHSPDDLDDITAVCRRKVKRQDVILHVDLDEEDEDFQVGMVFTKDSIFYWIDGGQTIEQFPYREIKQVDFSGGCILIEAEEAVQIALGNRAADENYPRYMYGFIMDILDYLKENESGQK